MRFGQARFSSGTWSMRSMGVRPFQVRISRPPVNCVAQTWFARTAGGRMKDVVVIGAGKIGATVAGLLTPTGDYQVTLADRSPEVLGNLDRGERIRIVAADV